MKRVIFLTIICLAFCLCFGAFPVEAQDPPRFPTTPRTKPDGGKFRIGFLQGGEYKDYLPVFRAVVIGLAELGWIPDTEIPKIPADAGTKGLWNWLSQPDRSPYIEFVPDAYYSGDWTDEMRANLKKQVLARLGGVKDLDLMIAMGTAAGQDLANDEHSIPTLVFSSSDPIKAQIIKSADDSGRDHIWARIDPSRYKRQVELFHSIIGFHKLGIVYENTEDGRSLCSMDRIEQAAKELGFELVPCYAPFSDIHSGEASRFLQQCHERLAPNVDALYLTLNRGVNPESMKMLLQPLFQFNIPTFSQSGDEEVRYGALMSIAVADFIDQGRFNAETIGKVFNSVKPSDIPMIFESPPKLAINLETAELIGFAPPYDVLGAADMIFSKIEEFDRR